MNDAEDQKEVTRIKEAMDEVIGVLKKYDLAGQTSLVSQTHSALHLRLDPTWSCIRLKEGTEYYVDLRRFGDDGPLLTKFVEDTLDLLHCLRDSSSCVSQDIERTLDHIKSHFDMVYKEGEWAEIKSKVDEDE